MGLGIWRTLLPKFELPSTIAGQPAGQQLPGDGGQTILVDLTRPDKFHSDELPNESLDNILKGGSGKGSVG